MNGREFNHTIAGIIKALPYQLRAPFLYRAGLYDGIWYTVSEVAHYLRLDENECRERLRQAADAICKQIGAAWEDYNRALPMVEESFLRELRTLVAEAKAPWNPNDVAREMQEAVRSFGVTLTMLGRSGTTDGLVAAVYGKSGSRFAQVLIQISPRSVEFINHILATVFCKRKPIGEHVGGSHLGIFGLCSTTDREVMYLDVDLSNDESVETWLSTYGINRICPPDEPFLFEPFERS